MSRANRNIKRAERRKSSASSVHWSERNGWKTAFRIGEIVAFFALGVGFCQFSEERAARETDREAYALAQTSLDEERIARAWATLATVATGNSGKIEALEYLNSKDVVLDGIDISCERMDGGWDAERLRCARPVYLQGADLAGIQARNANLQGANLRQADLQGAHLIYADLQGANLWHANLQGANLYDADLRDGNLQHANLQGADLRDANLQEANLYIADLQGADLRDANLQGADLQDANLQGAYLGGANFRDTNYYKMSNFSGAWFWDYDSPPQGLSGIELEECSSGYLDNSESDDEIVVILVDSIKPKTGCVPVVME